MKKYLFGSVGLMLLFGVVLIFTKPSEEDFFNRVAADYSQQHQGFELTKADLASMGSTHYSSSLFYSTYSYQFGNIKTQYWGFLGRIYYDGYDKNEETSPKNESLSV